MNTTTSHPGRPIGVAVSSLTSGDHLFLRDLSDLGDTEANARRTLRHLQAARVTVTIDGASFDLTRLTALRAINLLLQASRGLLWAPSARDLTTVL
ncbi:hypothetical protein M4D51_02820 [Microbacterium sp. p3-SID338]|uniref:hypothetical protein n=1 Tax=Microbacterium sp. p3-SID338 TaxID=2916214 RepID=UPI0021A4D59E|nr:hypothetical protein [Microbacterium sp. p3-SID338]MCT1394652.1 hypothetical protein [Microbacterium sp. p3-SID338]